MKVKVESEKAGLKQHSENKDHGIRSYHFMANRWEKVETVSDCIFIGSKINVDGDCSCEIKRHFLLRRIAMTNLDSVLESFNNKALYSQTYGFSSSHVQM